MRDWRKGRARAPGLLVIAVLTLVFGACGSSSPRAGGGQDAPPILAAAEPPPVASELMAATSDATWPALLNDLAGTRQAIVVSAPSYDDTLAALAAYERTASGWRLAIGPLTARIGYNGFAPVGEKFEGDGRTPSGVFGLEFLFGVHDNPGVRLPYRQITNEAIVWDVDPFSPQYNTWVDQSELLLEDGFESVFTPLGYEYAAVIGYNTERTPGLGSAIFLHEVTEETTLGCVALPVPELLEVLRWLDASADPRIVLGVTPSG